MTVDVGNVQLDVIEPPAAIVAVVPPERVAPAHVRRALHNGVFLAAGTIAAAVGSTLLFEHSAVTASAQAAICSAAWLLGIFVVFRALRTVHVAVGRVGLALFSSLTGLLFAGAESFWINAAEPSRLETLVMALLVFSLIFGLEGAKARLAELRARVLVVGGGKATQDLLEVLAREPEQPFRVIGVVDETTFETMGGVQVLGQVSHLRDVLEDHTPDLVVVAAERGRPEIFAGLAEGAELGFRVVGLPEFYEHAFARVPIRGMTDAWFMSILHLYQRSYPRLVKRSFDLVVAGLGLLLTAPLFPLIALLARTDGGPIFYRQVRLGEHGQLFTILKFRSMRTDAEQFGAVWAEESDPRITALGRVLRRTRLDELPQLLNVVRGDMSIVGPRPERPEFLEMLEEAVPFWSRRHLLRPGITGWAQLRSGYAADSFETEEKLAHDLWYLRHQSLLVDLVICGRTLPALFLGSGR
ncbi:MAG TPA: sugar transferase [Gaiellaceae bacterium]|nr:sugar transferase [Gaiellaceae bacterium]